MATTFKRRTDITRDEIMKQVCELNGMEYVPPKNRKSVNYIEILDDDGEPFIITKDGVVINKYTNGKAEPNLNSYRKKNRLRQKVGNSHASKSSHSNSRSIKVVSKRDRIIRNVIESITGKRK